MNERCMIIGGSLKECRKKANLKQKDVADKLGIKQQTYSGYESGKHEPEMETVIKLAELFNTSIDKLLGRFIHLPKDISEVASMYNISEAMLIAKCFEQAFEIYRATITNTAIKHVITGEMYSKEDFNEMINKPVSPS